MWLRHYESLLPKAPLSLKSTLRWAKRKAELGFSEGSRGLWIAFLLALSCYPILFPLVSSSKTFDWILDLLGGELWTFASISTVGPLPQGYRV